MRNGSGLAGRTGAWGLGAGSWGLETGDWGLGTSDQRTRRVEARRLQIFAAEATSWAY